MPTSYGFLSTFPPTECGLATFTAALATELANATPGCVTGVVRIVEEVPEHQPLEVVHHLLVSGGGEAEAAAHLNKFDVVIAQHEYGIYGGPDGDQVLEVFDELTVPLIVVLHTVLLDPTPHQREVLEGVLHAADAVVVMTPTARRRLLGGYPVDSRRVFLIPHGAPDNRTGPATATATPAGPPTILTWGLLGPGKGVEWGIDALADLADLETPPRYLVVGQTHPKVVEREGEAYRHGLAARAASHGVDHLVEFDARYLDSATLASIVREADVVLLPYDSREQVTSGVLVEALAAGKPVIATGFPHAVEMLSGGAGLIVPHADAPAIAQALRRVLSEPGVAEGLAAEASALADELLWPAVAGRYQSLAATITAARHTAVA